MAREVGVAAADELGPRSEASGSADWRRNLYAIVIAQALAIIGFSLRESFLPFYIKSLGASTTSQAAIWSGLISAGGAGVMALSAPFWGVISDRHGRKPMLLRAMFAAMICVGLMGLATAPWQLLALRFIEGGLTGTVTASTALVAASSPKARLGYSLGLVQTAVFSGASLGPFLGGLLSDQIGYRLTFLVSAGVLGLAGVLVLVFVHEQFTPLPRGSARGWSAVQASRGWLLAPILITMITVLFVLRFAQMAVRPIFPLYMQQIGDLTDARAASLSGLAFGLLGMTSAVAAVTLGRRGDRVGHRTMLLGGAIGAAVVFLPMAFVSAPWQLILLQGLFGIAAGGLIPAANALVAESSPSERRGVVFGLTSGAASLGAFFGPLMGSAIAATIGFRAAFLVTALLLIALACGIVWVFLFRYQSEAERLETR